MKILDFGRSIGETFWPTPWVYLSEVDIFPMPVIRDGRLEETYQDGKGRGVNLRISSVPEPPPDYEFVPLVSRLCLFHAKARLFLRQAAKPKSTAKKKDPQQPPETPWEEFVLRSELTAQALDGIAQHAGPDATAAAQALTIIRDFPDDLERFPYFFYWVQHLILSTQAPISVASEARPGAFAYTVLAARPFVCYHRSPGEGRGDPRVTDVYIVDDPGNVHDPLGRTEVL